MKQFLTYVLLFIGLTYVSAGPAYYRPYSDGQQKALQTQAFQSQQLMYNGNAHKGEVYEPFGAYTPSDQSEVGSSSSTNHPKGRINRFENPSDPGDQSEEYPIGDAWPLLAFAALFAGIIALKRKKAEC